MSVWKNFIAINCLLMFIMGYQSADAQENLAQQVSAIFEQSCLSCHGEHGAYTEEIIIRHHPKLLLTSFERFGKVLQSFSTTPAGCYVYRISYVQASAPQQGAMSMKK